jgi:hypothetical protein
VPDLSIGPAPVLAFLVGAFHSFLYVLIRGSAGTRFPFVIIAAVVGAYAGNAIGQRVGDPLRMGDFAIIWASIVAWVGIGLVVVATTIGTNREAE